MNQKEIINKTIHFVKTELSNTEGGHDWWHIYRVWNNAKHIAREESVDDFVVELGALLHDIADSKFHDGDEEIGPRITRNLLTSLNVKEEIISHIEKIIMNISFKGGNHTQKFSSPELDVIQDADRLDALGAIGIARTFNYGGFKNRKIYDPTIKPDLNMTEAEYKTNEGHSINHFYEKLLLLKNRMNTSTGKKIAQKRHEFLEHYLKTFFDEWEGRA